MIPVFDGHNDTLLNLLDTGRDYYERSDIGHIDDVRAREGGLAGGFFACFVPTPTGSHAPTPEQREALLGAGVRGVEIENEWGGPSLPFAQQFTNAMVAKLLNLEAGGGSMLRDRANENPPTVSPDPLTISQYADELEENVEEGRSDRNSAA